jgi:calmodulin
MPLDAARKAAFEEAFEIIGQKAARVNSQELGIIMRSLGQNPLNKEIDDLFAEAAGGESSIALDAVLAVAGKYEDQMKTADQMQMLTEAFRVFDKEKNNKITSACAAAGGPQTTGERASRPRASRG